jgi:hypothetical protein
MLETQTKRLSHTYLLAEIANWFIVVIQDNADLIHEPYLFFIMPIQCSRAGVNVGKQL